MSKVCTSLKQSKKLIELGINISTADMHYVLIDSDKEIYDVGFGDYIGILPHHPAWSLTALLELMPKLYEFENDPDDGGCQPNLCKGWDNNQWHIVYRSSIYITEWHDEPIDAAFEMVVWLKENGKYE